MSTSIKQPIYDPKRTYDDNFDNGPFGEFSKPEVYKNEGEPKFTFLGYPIFSPFGIPAGPLLNSNYVISSLKKGFDVVTYKTQRNVEFSANEFPNVLYVEVDGDLTLEKASSPLVGRTTTESDPTSLTITNSFGNPSRGPEFWVDDLKKAVNSENKGQLVIMSVVGTIQPGFSDEDYYNDFAATAKLASTTGVKAIEVNLSCPNVANEGILCYTPNAVAEICRRTKEAIGDIPLIAKVGYYSVAQQGILETVVENMAPYVDAICAINTIAAPIVDNNGEQALPGPNRLKSGMCGAGIKWAGIEMVKRLNEIRAQKGYKFEIIGVGGVMNPEDFDTYRESGADIVQSATGAMWNSNLAVQIKETL